MKSVKLILISFKEIRLQCADTIVLWHRISQLGIQQKIEESVKVKFIKRVRSYCRSRMPVGTFSARNGSTTGWVFSTDSCRRVVPPDLSTTKNSLKE